MTRTSPPRSANTCAACAQPQHGAGQQVGRQPLPIPPRSRATSAGSRIAPTDGSSSIAAHPGAGPTWACGPRPACAPRTSAKSRSYPAASSRSTRRIEAPRRLAPCVDRPGDQLERRRVTPRPTNRRPRSTARSSLVGRKRLHCASSPLQQLGRRVLDVGGHRAVGHDGHVGAHGPERDPRRLRVGHGPEDVSALASTPNAPSRRSTSAPTRSTSSSPTCTPATATSTPSSVRRRCCAWVTS